MKPGMDCKEGTVLCNIIDLIHGSFNMAIAYQLFGVTLRVRLLACLGLRDLLRELAERPRDDEGV